MEILEKTHGGCYFFDFIFFVASKEDATKKDDRNATLLGSGGEQKEGDKDQVVLKWRVENSWGTDKGDKGYLSMSNGWFDEYVFQIAVKKSLCVEHGLLKYLNEKPIVLPAWDPMGALAKALPVVVAGEE